MPEQHPRSNPEAQYERDTAGMVRLEKGDKRTVDGAKPIYPPEEIGLTTRDYDGSELSVVMELAVQPREDEPSLHAVLLKRTYPNGAFSYRLRGLSAAQTNRYGRVRRQVLPISDDIPSVPIMDGVQTFGRAETDGSHTSAADIWGKSAVANSDMMSRQHITLVKEQEGGVTIINLSANGTYLRALQGEKLPTHRAVYTRLAVEEAQRRGRINKDGTYQGEKKSYEVLSRDKPVVDGVVDLRSQPGGGEAIIVDSADQEYAGQYVQLYGDFRARLNAVRAKDGSYSDEAVAKVIWESVRGAMKYKLGYVNDLSDKMRAIQGSSHEVNLGQYLKDGKGICRQMALAAAWLANQAASRGLIQGTTTSEANSIVNDKSGHEWARWTAKDGTVYIIDPAYGYHGTLQGSLERKRDGKDVWEYFRPGEKQAYEALLEKQGALAKLRAIGNKILGL